MANRTKRTLEKDTRFLTRLAENGNVGRAAEAAGYGRRQLYVWRKDDAAFADAWDDAVAGYVELLEAEADRRALHGVSKPVFHKGEVVGSIQMFSDTLLMFRLNALRPDIYRRGAVAAAIAKTVPDAATAPVEAAGLTPETINLIRRDILGIPEVPPA